MKPRFDRVRAVPRRRGLARNRDGNATVEMALAALPLLMFLFAIFNAGHALWLQNALDMSVSDAARCAAINPSLCGTANQIKAYAASRSGAGFDSSIFT